MMDSKFQSEKAQSKSHSRSSNFYWWSHHGDVGVLIVQLKSDLLYNVFHFRGVSGGDIPNRLSEPRLGSSPVGFLVEPEEGLVHTLVETMVADGFVSWTWLLVGHRGLKHGN